MSLHMFLITLWWRFRDSFRKKGIMKQELLKDFSIAILIKDES